jgi:hypothetical protein
MFTTKFNKNQNDGVFAYLKNTLVGISVIELNTSTLTALEITFQMDNIVFLAYAIYRSPSNKDLDKTLNEINDLILRKSISKTANFKIILGDMNINLLRPSKIKNDYLLLMMEYG